MVLSVQVSPWLQSKKKISLVQLTCASFYVRKEVIMEGFTADRAGGIMTVRVRGGGCCVVHSSCKADIPALSCACTPYRILWSSKPEVWGPESPGGWIKKMRIISSELTLLKELLVSKLCRCGSVFMCGLNGNWSGQIAHVHVHTWMRFAKCLNSWRGLSVYCWLRL